MTDGGSLSASKGSMPVVRAWIHAILGIAATSSGDTSCAFAASTVASGACASASLSFEVAKICRDRQRLGYPFAVDPGVQLAVRFINNNQVRHGFLRVTDALSIGTHVLFGGITIGLLKLPLNKRVGHLSRHDI